MSRNIPLILVLTVQIVCAVFYVINIISTITGFAQFSWMVHELIEPVSYTHLTLPTTSRV